MTKSILEIFPKQTSVVNLWAIKFHNCDEKSSLKNYILFFLELLFPNTCTHVSILAGLRYFLTSDDFLLVEYTKTKNEAAFSSDAAKFGNSFFINFFTLLNSS